MKAKTLSQALHYEFSVHNKNCHISTSIGVAVSPKAGTDFETLYQNAGSALYKTKKNGKNGYSICHPAE